MPMLPESACFSLPLYSVGYLSSMIQLVPLVTGANIITSTSFYGALDTS